MEIAKGISDDDYNALDLNDLKGPDWPAAIEIFRNRFFPRYIEPINQLLDLEANSLSIGRKYGFTIMAIDCLLLETLQCFYEGRKDSNGLGVGEGLFVNFLTQTKCFKSQFDQTKSKLFYKHIRCGILHQAETSLNSRILSVGPIVTEDNGSLIINRTEFHIAMKTEFLTYIALISNPENEELRRFFKVKMDFIARKK